MTTSGPPPPASPRAGSPSPASTPAVDATVLDQLKETAGAEFVHELVDTFLAEAPTMLADLRDAFSSGDAERFRRTAHSLKSNANTFGAETLAALARGLELGGMEPVREASGAPIDVLALEYSRVADALKELARG